MKLLFHALTLLVSFSALTAPLSAQCVWRVRDTELGVAQEWTWTQKGSSNEYDAVRRNLQTGKTETFAFRMFERNPDRSVVLGRIDFVGRYRGTYSLDGKSAKGWQDWTGVNWTAEISGCGLGAAVEKPAGGQVTGIAPGARWTVLETAGARRWEAVWTVKPDGKSLSATWTHYPGGQTGSEENFGTIESVTGNQIVIRRPGLGTYTGTIDTARGRISGRPSWADATVEVSLTGAPLRPPELHVDREEDFAGAPKGPAPKSPVTQPAAPAKPASAAPPAVPPKKPEILVDTAEDLGKMPVFRNLTYGPFGMKAETSWKDSVTDKTMTLTWEGDLLKKIPGAKIRFAEQGAAFKTPAERAQLVKKWKTPPPNAPMPVANGKLGEIAAECVRRDQPKTKTTMFECVADNAGSLYRFSVEAPGLVKEWPRDAQAVLSTLRWLNSSRIKKYAGPHPIEKAIAALPKMPVAGGSDFGFPANRAQKSFTAEQYAASVQTAMAGFRELAGQMPPEQDQKLVREWSSFLQEPSPEAMTYLDGLVPVMEEFLAARETIANAAVSFDRAWADAIAAATIDDEEGAATALAAARQNQLLLASGQARLDRVLAESERIGNPPDLRAARERAKGAAGKTPAQAPAGGAPKTGGAELAGVWINDKMTHGLFPMKDGSFGEIECDSPQMGCTVMEWTLTRARPGLYTPDRGEFTISLMSGGIRWNTTKDWPAYKGDFTRADLSNPPMPYDPGLVERMRKSDQARQVQGASMAAAPDDEGISWPCHASNFMCMAELNARRKYTAAAVAKLILNPPASLREATVIAAGGGAPVTSQSPASTPLSMPRSEKEVREAIAEHQTWIQAIEKSLAKDRADLAKAKTSQAQDLLQWRILNAEANLQAERDLVQSLETGTYVHTRTTMDDVLHAQMIDRSREYNANVDATRRYADRLMRLADTASTPEETRRAREFISRQLTAADIASGNLEKARQTAKAVSNLVQDGNLAAGARAREQAENADDLLRYAERTKTVAAIAMTVLAPAAVAELGFTAATNTVLTYGVGTTYGGVTGLVEGGPKEALRQAVSQSSLAGAVAVEAMDGYQESGARGAVENAAITFLSGKLVEYGASKAAGVYARIRGVQIPPEKLSNITVDEWRTHVSVLNAKDDAQRLIGLFKTATGEQRQRLAAEINSNYMAKLLIKQGGAAGPGRPLETDAVSMVRELYRTRVDPAFRSAVERQGFRWQERGPDGVWREAAPLEFREFRQASKRETFNIDRDLGLLERDPSRFRIVQNGQPMSLHEAERALQPLYEQSYRAGMFGQDPRKAFQNITTTTSGEAYRQGAFTRLTSKGQANFWRDPWAQQAGDVARDKVFNLDKASMSGAVKLIEQARTAAKEIEQRVLPQLQRANADPARSEYWRRVQQSLNTMVSDPVAGQRMLRITSGEDSLRGVIDRIGTAIEAGNKLGR
jgi:hypothetical protein